MSRIDPDDTYDESTNPSNGWRSPVPAVQVRTIGHCTRFTPAVRKPARRKTEFEVVCLECGAKFMTDDGDYCEVCGGGDLELA